MTHLEHPGSGFGAILQEAGSLFAGRLLQPALVVHVCQTLGAPDLSAGRLVVRPNAIQSDFSPPANTRNKPNPFRQKRGDQLEVLSRF